MLPRSLVTLALLAASIGLVLLVTVRLGPWLWPRLFPRVGEGTVEAAERDRAAVPGAQEVGELVDRLVAGWGAELRPEPAPIELPRGRSPDDLQAALREEPALSGAQVYVTPVDEVLHRLRVYDGPRLLASRAVRAWMPERPAVRAEDPPELGLILEAGPADGASVKRAVRWRSPLAVALPPFEPESLRLAKTVSRAGKDLVVRLGNDAPPGEQMDALPGVTGAVLAADAGEEFREQAAEAAARRALFLLDPQADARRGPVFPGTPSLHEPEGAVVARNLAIRRGWALVTAPVDEAGLEAAERFLEAAQEDGYFLALPAEVARMHAAGGSLSAAP